MRWLMARMEEGGGRGRRSVRKRKDDFKSESEKDRQQGFLSSVDGDVDAADDAVR